MSTSWTGLRWERLSHDASKGRQRTFAANLRLIHKERHVPATAQAQPEISSTRTPALQNGVSASRRLGNNSAFPWLRRKLLPGVLVLLTAVLVLPCRFARAGQSAETQSGAAQPEAHVKTPTVEPCRIKREGAALANGAAAGAMAANPDAPVLDPSLQPGSCPPLEPLIDWYARFLSGPRVKPMTPKEKAWLAVRNLGDPFNAITILGEAGISVAANSHSPYGPGFPGWGRYVGVSYTQDMTGEFFGTFLIPSIAGQDPHYHRMPEATIPRRAWHTVEQVFWTQGDNGHPMVNYADLVGFAIDDEIGNLYVPGQQTRLTASAERYGITVATAPIENVITEFLPDVARRIHVHVVLVQRIVNQVARTDNNGQ